MGGPGPYGQPGGGPVAYSPIEAVKFGWDKFTKNWVPWVLAILVIGVITAVVVFVVVLAAAAIIGTGTTTYDPATNTYVPSGGVVAGLGALFFVYMVLIVVLSFLVNAQVARAALETTDTGHIEFSVFTRTNLLGTLVVASLLTAIFVLLGAIACCIGAVVVAFFLQFYAYTILDGSATGAMGGIKASWNFVAKNMSNVLLWVLVLIGIGIVLGIIGFILGLIPFLGLIFQVAVSFVLSPTLWIAHAYTYRVLSGRPVAA